MTITVAIASFNYGLFSAQAIDSVVGQMRKADEIIFIDDYSNRDDVGCYMAELYGIKTIKREENFGTLKNFNDILFNQVKTDYLMMLGADNWLRPDALMLMSKEDADIISSDYYFAGSGMNYKKFVENEKNYIKDGYWIRKFQDYPNNEVSKRKILRKNFIHGSSLYNVKLAREVGGYEVVTPHVSGRRLAEDWGLWKKMLKNNAVLKHLPLPLLYRRSHQFNFNGIF